MFKFAHVKLTVCLLFVSVIWNQGKGIIGQDVVLNCTANGRKCTGSFKWVGGPNDKVLTYKNKVLDSQKYAVNYIHAKEYALIIRNLSNIDLNVLYVCHCGFYHYGNILRLHEQHTYTSKLLVYQLIRKGFY